MNLAGYIFAIGMAYLAGSIPTGYLVGRARGIDIRTLGSGNIGATNVFRHFGKWAGGFVLLVDALKGWLSAGVLPLLVGAWWPSLADGLQHEWVSILTGVAAILGHNYTCWLRFKGGKGIATSAGVLIALVTNALLIILAVFILVLVTSRYVSLASMLASAVLPFATWFCGYSLTMVIITAILAALAIYKHRANIKRLLNGTENRLAPKPRPPAL